MLGIFLLILCIWVSCVLLEILIDPQLSFPKLPGECWALAMARKHQTRSQTVHSRHEAGYACDIHWTRIAETPEVQRPEQRPKKQNAFETVMPRTWPVKILGLLLAMVAVVLMSEILSVLLNLPEDNFGVLRRFE
jgi:hypothetical protein